MKSCGCFRREFTTDTSSTHRLSKTRTYSIWKGVIKRCLNKGSRGYRHYGGRGIKVCDQWLAFEAFLADMGECPAGMSIDRIDNDGDYTPENCRWATKAQQARNTCRAKTLTLNGLTLPLKEWAELSGIKYHTLYQRVRDGRPLEHMLSQPSPLRCNR